MAVDEIGGHASRRPDACECYRCIELTGFAECSADGVFGFFPSFSSCRNKCPDIWRHVAAS
jgi:hypothetical protein